MFDNNKRKLDRLNTKVDEEMPVRIYNTILGGLVAYGLLLGGILGLIIDVPPESFGVFVIGYFISCIAGSIMAIRSSSPIVSFIGYNLVAVPVGILLDIALSDVEGVVVTSAFIVTGIIVIAMIGAATIKPELFRTMGGTLLTVLIVGIVGEIIATLLGYGGDLFNWLFVILFSLYLGFDWCKAQDYPKTLDNAIDSALDIYLDIINLLLRLVEILGRKKD